MIGNREDVSYFLVDTFPLGKDPISTWFEGKDRWMVGWMDGRVDGWTDNEWTDGLTGELISFLERSVMEV